MTLRCRIRIRPRNIPPANEHYGFIRTDAGGKRAGPVISPRSIHPLQFLPLIPTKFTPALKAPTEPHPGLTLSNSPDFPATHTGPIVKHLLTSLWESHVRGSAGRVNSSDLPGIKQ